MNEKQLMEIFDKLIEYSKERNFNVKIDFAGIDYNQRTGVMSIDKITCHSQSEKPYELPIYVPESIKPRKGN